jgi:hypothetical protein
LHLEKHKIPLNSFREGVWCMNMPKICDLDSNRTLNRSNHPHSVLESELLS